MNTIQSLNAKTVAQLRVLAKRRKIPEYSQLKKRELIQALLTFKGFAKLPADIHWNIIAKFLNGGDAAKIGFLNKNLLKMSRENMLNDIKRVKDSDSKLDFFNDKPVFFQDGSSVNEISIEDETPYGGSVHKVFRINLEIPRGFWNFKRDPMKTIGYHPKGVEFLHAFIKKEWWFFQNFIKERDYIVAQSLGTAYVLFRREYLKRENMN